MATSSSIKRFTRQESWLLFVAIAFPIHVWALIMIFMDLNWVGERTNYWDAVGVASYGLMYTLLESFLVFGFTWLISLFLIKIWTAKKLLALLGVLALFLTIWGILGQLYFLLNWDLPSGLITFLAGSGHPLRWLYAGLFVLVFFITSIPVLLTLLCQKCEDGFLKLIAQISPLMGLYLFLDLAGILIVIMRNIF